VYARPSNGASQPARRILVDRAALRCKGLDRGPTWKASTNRAGPETPSNIAVQWDLQPLLHPVEMIMSAQIPVIEGVPHEEIQCLACRTPVASARWQMHPERLGLSIKHCGESTLRGDRKLGKVDPLQVIPGTRHNVFAALVPKRSRPNGQLRSSPLEKLDHLAKARHGVPRLQKSD